jgi:hypothetical protein
MRTSSRIRAARLALVPGAALTVAALTTAALAACGAGSAGPGPSAPGPAGTTSAGGAPTTATAGAPAGATLTPSATATSSVPAVPSPSSAPSMLPGSVPAGFAASSVTFVSVDEAFVLGTAPCAHAPCTSILRTLDRGVSWVGLPAPVVPLGAPYTATSPAVWGIRFANPEQGFVFGNGLWATADGGEQWTAITSPGGLIADLEVIDSQVLALSYVCTAQSGCSQGGTLYRRALSGGAWSVVTRINGERVIATQARVAAVLDGGKVVVTGDGGLTIAVRDTPCDTQALAASAVAVSGPGSLALLCAGGAAAGSVQKTVYVSGNLGASWTTAGSPPLGGDPFEISAGPPTGLTVAAASGASFLYYSADDGLHWSIAYKAIDGGAGFSDLGFTTPADGVVVSGAAFSDGNSIWQPGTLLLTSDGGASWAPVRF